MSARTGVWGKAVISMKMRKHLLGAGVLAAATMAFGGTASAAFPNFSDCPRATIRDAGTCVDIQSTGGHLTIKGFEVPIGESLEIRGGARFTETGNTFIPPAGTNGFFARAIQVPGGLLGINFPIPGNKVTATARLVGPASNIRLDLGAFGVSVPIKLELRNPLIGPFCQIGSNSNPVRLNLITGTTSPPAPNRPISGGFGTFVATETYFSVIGNRNVDNSFAVPGANSCGLGFTLIDSLVNAKLRIPSAGGNNEMVIVNNVGLQAP